MPAEQGQSDLTVSKGRGGVATVGGGGVAWVEGGIWGQHGWLRGPRLHAPHLCGGNVNG